MLTNALQNGMATPAIPDVPTSAFQDISLDDGALKLDFTLDGLGAGGGGGGKDTKAKAGGFGSWGNTWEFASGKDDSKTDSLPLGSNNPWSPGTKSKKNNTNTMSDFDFGDFSAAQTNTLNFGATDDTTNNNTAADDAWGFNKSSKKDKKKKGGIEDFQEEPDVSRDLGYPTEGNASKIKQKPNSNFDSDFLNGTTADTTTKTTDSTFDWDFGSKKDKKKKVSSSAAIGDPDSHAGSKGIEDDSNDPWAAFSTGKDKKKTKGDTFGDLSEIKTDDVPAADGFDWGVASFGKKKNKVDAFGFDLNSKEEAQLDSVKAPMVAWDDGLSAKDKRKLEKEMKMNGTWEDRITQDMVDQQNATLAEESHTNVEHISTQPDSFADEVAWDDGLSSVKKRKKEKEMRENGTWDSRITQEMIDKRKETAATTSTNETGANLSLFESGPVDGTLDASVALDDLLPWDHGLSPVKKRKKEKEMRAEGIWEDRLTETKIEEMRAAARNPTSAADENKEEADLDSILEPPPPPPAPGPPVERVAWDHGLTPAKKKKKEKEMKLDGTWDSRLTKEQIDDDNLAATLQSTTLDSVAVDDSLSPPPPPALDSVQPRVAWDFGLTAVKKRKKEKEMKLDGTWDSRITQEQLDAEAAAVAPDFPSEAAIEHDKPDPTESARVAWDHGLSAKEKKKKEKEMRLDFTWDDRITQEMLDVENDIKDKEQAEAPHDESKVVQPRVAWDHELDAKARKKKEREMKLDYTWEDRVTQEMIDIDNSTKAEPTVKAASLKQDKGEAPESRVAWDHGLDAKARKKKEREMRANYTWEDRITQEMIDDENTNKAGGLDHTTEEIAQVVKPRLPWDHGLTPLQKRKQEKSMRAEGTWDDRLTQDKIDEEDAAAREAQGPKAISQPGIDDSTSGGWGFGWGGDTKGTKNSLSGFNSNVDKHKDKIESGWGGGWDLDGDKKKDKDTSTSKKDKLGDMWSTGADADGKKKKSKGADVTDTTMPEGTTAPVEEDIWATFGASTKSDKKDKKSKKNGEDAAAHVNLTADTMPAPEPSRLPDIDDFDWDGLGSGRKSNKSPAEEAPAKKSGSSLWGFGSSSTPAKSKKEKEKDTKAKKEAEESETARVAEQQMGLFGEDELVGTAKKTKSKSKTTTAEKKTDDLLDLLDEPVPVAFSSKDKKSSKTSEHKVDDYFGAWGASGSSKKTGGKKLGQETKSTFATNEMDDLPELNEDEIQAVLDEFPATSSKKLSSTQTTIDTKAKTKSSIADRIKAFEAPEGVSEKKSKSKDASGRKDEIDDNEPLSPIGDKKSKAKAATKTSSSKTKDSTSPPASEKKKSKDSVPGGFPGAFDLDEEAKDDGDGPVAVPASSTAKVSTKTVKAETKPAKPIKSKRASVTFDRSMDADEVKPVLLDDGEPDELVTKPATPPLDAKSTSKKLRPKVAATSSWGLFGATSSPKKSSKSRPADDMSTPDSKKAPALTRSKSSRTSKEKAEEDKKAMSKSSSSDAGSSGKKVDKPKSASRGMSFANFMLGGAPPSAMRDTVPLKRSSTVGSRASSRRQSVDQSGLLSPATDEEKQGKKSSRSLQRRSSTKGKSKDNGDSFALDDGDLVMVDGDDVSTPKARPSEGKVKRRSSTKPRSKTISGDEDTVMVDAPGPIENGVLSGGDEFERPALSRSNTAKRMGGLLGSLFGGGARTPTRPQSNPVSDAEDKVRGTGTPRRRRTTLDQEADFGTDNPTETDAEAAARRKARRVAKEQAEEEERAAREQRRKDRRDREKADLEARRERAREQARKDREAEDAAKAERRARRKAREAEERARMEKEEADAAEAAEKRREQRRRAREKLEAEAGANVVSKDERRRTFAEEEEIRRSRRKEKGGERDESHRKSSALMADYHESRSGSGRGIKPPSNKTSNWVHSQTDELPDPPPLVGTVLDGSDQKPRPVDDGEAASRRHRHHRSSKDKYAGMTEEEIAQHRARRRERKVVEQEKEKSTSGGSEERRDGEKRSTHRWSRVVEDDYYTHGSHEPVRISDGRPGLSRGDTKRSSFLSKFF